MGCPPVPLIDACVSHCPSHPSVPWDVILSLILLTLFVYHSSVYTYTNKSFTLFWQSIYIYYSPLPERPRLSLRTINLIQSGMPVRKCISGEKSDIVLSNHNYGRRQIKAKWNNEEFGYFNTITKIANAILCSLFMFWL